MAAAQGAPHWADIGESTSVAGVLFLCWVHRWFGRWPFRLCVWPVVACHWLGNRIGRQASMQYLQRLQAHSGVLGRAPTRRDSLRHFFAFADTMLDKILGLGGRYPAERIHLHRDLVLQKIARREGGLILTAHIGCLELCQVLAEQVPGFRITVLVHTAHAQRFNRLLQRLDPLAAVELVQVTEMGPATAVMLAERVAAGGFVAIVGDRTPVQGGRSVTADFLGHRAPFPIGAYVLAAALGCPVYTMACLHEGDGYRVAFEQFAEPCCRVARATPRWPNRHSASRAGWNSRSSSPRWTGSISSPSGIRLRMTTDAVPVCRFGDAPLTIEDVVALAQRQCEAALSDAPAFRAHIQRGADFLDRLLREDGVIYGVTTGYGDSCTVNIPPALVAELPHHLYTYHGCGLGRYLDPVETRAVLAARLASLVRGMSGVSVPLLEGLATLLQHDVLPMIPAEGSVGASGDLTPLSYVAAVLCGEREVLHDGRVQPAAEVLAKIGMTPLKLRPKEGLAIMNGTAVMTGLACLAWQRADYLARMATRLTAFNVLASDGNAHHFDETLFAAKPHPGQGRIAARLRSDLHSERPPRNEQRLQDRYSLRCAPHVIGVLEDSLPFLRQLIETELNSANDNPLIDADGERILHGGHFYGGHIALAMDTLKNTVANVADLLDRQLALVVDARYNHGLPANLSAATGARAAINHGLKALQISVSAWTAEALKQTMPASVFSRSTECHNQDKVSMGTIAARDCLRVIELTEQVVAAMLIAARQGLALRERVGLNAQLHGSLADMYADLGQRIALVEEDRALDRELRELLVEIRAQRWELYAGE